MTIQEKLNLINMGIMIFGLVMALIFAFSAKEFRHHWLRWVAISISGIISLFGYFQYNLSNQIDNNNLKKEKEQADINAVLKSNIVALKEQVINTHDSDSKEMGIIQLKLDSCTGQSKNTAKSMDSMRMRENSLNIEVCRTQLNSEGISSVNPLFSTNDNNNTSLFTIYICAKNNVIKNGIKVRFIPFQKKIDDNKFDVYPWQINSAIIEWGDGQFPALFMCQMRGTNVMDSTFMVVEVAYVDKYNIQKDVFIKIYELKNKYAGKVLPEVRSSLRREIVGYLRTKGIIQQ